MYECPNCAGNLRFHIGKQQLYCEHCDTTLPPYTFHKESDAEEQEYYEVTIFTCPQCGGELLTEDNTAATFCSYCGASTILFDRISQEKRPKYIIPFTKTKEDCKASYTHMVKRAFFAPKELRDAECIDQFRGIYMPYWLYSFRKNGMATFKGVKTHTEGNEEITEYYDIQCNVNAQYDDIAFDASSEFADNLSRTIAPFDMTQKKPFTPAYLSGFYADSNDIAPDAYRQDAEKVVLDDVCEHLEPNCAFSSYDIKKQMESATMAETLKPETTYTELAMLPVWFLSYRKKDRVAYAIVNGQTGEAAADLPIDMRRFTISSLLLAIPIILLLNAFLTLTPAALLAGCMVVASLFAVIANHMTTQLLLKESYQDAKLYGAQDAERKRQKDKLKTFFSYLLVLLLEIPYLFFFLFLKLGGKYMVLPAVVTLIFMIYIGMDLSHLSKPHDIYHLDMDVYHETWNKKLRIMLKPLFTIVVALVVLLLNPVSDITYYGAGMLCLAMILWSIWDMVGCHNLLTTRRLPQLNKRGGTDNV